MAKLNSKATNALADNQFAYIDAKGGKHLPIPDADHVRDALARFSQTQFDNDDDKKAAAKRLASVAAKYKIDVDDASPVGQLAGDDDDDAEPDGDAEMAERVSLYALQFGERVDLAEGKPIPFAAVGDWQFDEYGSFAITRDDLATMKANFDADVRRQRLPIINEAHNPDRAVGWIKDLVYVGPDRLAAVPDWTPTGEQLIKNGEYGYTSPEMEYRTMVLRNWADPEHPTVKHPTVAAGLALTNFPKIKKLGAIAASEGRVGCELIACSEHPITADHPMRAARLLMGESDPDDDGDDDGSVVACIYQPPIAAVGCCPGYTRRPKDTDGDGTCLFADKGCNGYRPVSGDQAVAQAAVGNSPTAVTFVPNFSEVHDVIPHLGTERTMPETAAPEVGTPAKPEAAVDNAAALMAENRDLVAKFAESEKQRIALGERVAAMERERTLDKMNARFSELVRTGRISPAERDALIGGEKGEENAIKLSETEFVIAALEARAVNSAVDMSERGVSNPKDGEGNSAHDDLVAFAEELRKTDPKLTREGAYLLATEQHPELFAQSRGARQPRAAGVA